MSRVAVWLLVAALAIVYPLAVLVTGGASFPTRDECVRPATADGEIDAVFGYFDTELEAAPVLQRALDVGFQGTDMTWNGCGRVRVAVGGIPTLEVGQEFVEQARTVDFEVTLEQAS